MVRPRATDLAHLEGMGLPVTDMPKKPVTKGVERGFSGHRKKRILRGNRAASDLLMLRHAAAVETPPCKARSMNARNRVRRKTHDTVLTASVRGERVMPWLLPGS